MPDEHLKIKLTKDQLHTVFHALWTECVGTAAYDKAAWTNVQRQLEAVLPNRRAK